MKELKAILKSWALTAIIFKWVMLAAVVGTGLYVTAGPGVDVRLSIYKGVDSGE